MSKKVIYFFIYHTAATHRIISDINLKGKYRCRVWYNDIICFANPFSPIYIND